MKTKIILLGAVITTFAFTSFAAEPLLSPRAQGNQINGIPNMVQTPTVTVTYVAPSAALLSPRAQGNQIIVAKGVANDVNPALVCAHTMAGSPKAVAACSSNTTMPGCVAVAVLK